MIFDSTCLFVCFIVLYIFVLSLYLPTVESKSRDNICMIRREFPPCMFYLRNIPCCRNAALQYDATDGVLCEQFLKVERHRAFKYVAVFEMKVTSCNFTDLHSMSLSRAFRQSVTE